MRIANHWYALVRPVVNSILSASLIAGGFEEEIIEDIKGYGTVKVMMRIARFKLIVNPMKKKVALKPEAIPLRWGGTAPMIELMLGELNRPIPAPKMTRSSANWAYEVRGFVIESRYSERLIIAKPEVVNAT